MFRQKDFVLLPDFCGILYCFDLEKCLGKFVPDWWTVLFLNQVYCFFFQFDVFSFYFQVTFSGVGIFGVNTIFSVIYQYS